MEKIERVYRALSLEEPDKVPKGELQIHDELVSAIIGEPVKDWFDAHVKVREMIKMDALITIFALINFVCFFLF